MPRTKKPKIDAEKIEQIMWPKAERTMKPQANETKKLISAKILLSLAGIILIGGLLFFAGYYYLQYKKMLASQNVSVQSEIKTLTDKIGKFVDLPTNEEPTMAEVKDTEKLKGQLFFANAQNGDKVLIYSQNRKAILYRPATNKVIEVTSLAEKTDNQDTTPASTPNDSAPADNAQTAPASQDSAPTTPVENQDTQKIPTEESVQPKNVFVYNGSKIKGLAAKLADEISAGVTGAEIAGTGNAVGNYPATIVVDLSGNNADLIQKIVAVTGGTAGELPANEKKPEGDILVIGGGK